MTQAMDQQEMLADRRVTYTLEMDGRFFVVENVPARVNVETGEQLFSPQTVERLQRLIRDGGQPVRMMETPVYKFVG
jgi:YgiT-type zinc finger domain-containing protein